MPRRHRILSVLAVLFVSLVAAAVLMSWGASSLRTLVDGTPAPPAEHPAGRPAPAAERHRSGGWSIGDALILAAADSIAGLALCIAAGLLLVKHRLDARETRE